MKLLLAEPKYLKDSIAIISDLVSEARFTFSPEGITLVAMDPANVAMVIYKLMPTLFAQYDVKEKVDITLNLTNFKQILKRAGSSDTITLEMEGGNKLKMTITGKTIRRFSLPIIATDEREQKTPNLSFPLTIKAPVELLNEAVEDASVVADSLVFESEGKFLKVSAAGDLNNLEVEMRGDSVEIINELKGSTAKSRYAIEYLKKMIGGAKLSDTVKIQFNKDYPLRLEYVTVDKVLLAFILAPRVEHE
jgi:proliferating cell nuclear antigen